MAKYNEVLNSDTLNFGRLKLNEFLKFIDEAALVFEKNLTTTDDLNTVTKTGVYLAYANNTPENSPVNETYVLINTRLGNTSSNQVQLIFGYNKPFFYYRRIFNNGTSLENPIGWANINIGQIGRDKLTKNYAFVKSLTSNDDVNQKIDTGLYMSPGTTSANGIAQNFPITEFSYLLNLNFNDSYVIQIVFPHSNPANFLIRILGGSTATTSEWVSLSEFVKSVIPTVGSGSQQLLNKKLMILGDSNSYSNKYQGKVEQITGATITTNAFNGSRYAITNNATYDPESFYAKATTLDFTGYDALFIMYGTNDMGNNVPLGDFVSGDSKTVKGALKLGLERLMTTYPAMRIYIGLPIYRNDMTTNTLGLTAKDYEDAIIEVANTYGITPLNTRLKMGVNSLNYATYYSDSIHVNTLGGEVLGKVVGNYINSN